MSSSSTILDHVAPGFASASTTGEVRNLLDRHGRFGGVPSRRCTEKRCISSDREVRSSHPPVISPMAGKSSKILGTPIFPAMGLMTSQAMLIVNLPRPSMLNHHCLLVRKMCPVSGWFSVKRSIQNVKLPGFLVRPSCTITHNTSQHIWSNVIWLVVLTILKNISQWEGLSHILWKINKSKPPTSYIYMYTQDILMI